jgi:energy-coupling factor transporter transmembrane protein EcfT
MGRFGWIHALVSTLIVVALLIVVAAATSWWILVVVAILVVVGTGAGLLVGRRLRARDAKSP